VRARAAKRRRDGSHSRPGEHSPRAGPSTDRVSWAGAATGGARATLDEVGPGEHPAQVGHGPIDPGVDIGHVHLKVADLDRALAFYVGVLGFDLTARFGDQAAFVSAGGYHHHIGLNTWESKGGQPAPGGTTGLYHLAIRYPTRASLADAYRRLLDAGIPLQGASDHGVSEALYLADLDGNGVELYRDRPREQWPRTPEGELTMYTRPLDLQSLLGETSDLGEQLAAARPAADVA